MHRLLVLLIGLFSSAVLAQSDPAVTMPLEPLSSPYLLKLTGGLLLVVIIIFGLAWLVKKFNLNQQSQNGLIRIIAGLSIGARDRIVLLQIGEEQILVGLTPGRIEKLHTMSEPLEVGEGEMASSPFAEKFNRLVGERDKS
ncbi:MAG: flagellar biosynthetic protein FliO [Gammaproteobacteria bacterium]|nr:flagellar biosynthetic protein FliO [Gammaproteobacteria bacterium]